MVRSRRPDRKGPRPRSAPRSTKHRERPAGKRGPGKSRAAGRTDAQRQEEGSSTGNQRARAPQDSRSKPKPAKPGKRAAKGTTARQPTSARAKAPRPAERGGPLRTSKGIWLYGRHAVEAALENPRRSCHRLLALPEALDRLGARAKRPGLEVVVVERDELERRFGADAVHQGLALSAAPLPRLDLDRTCAPEAGSNLVLVLDQITDPHNLGAILRSAAAFEARAVVVPERRSAELGGAAAKAASGALDVVPVVEVSNIARALDQLASLGYWRLGLDGEAPQTLEDVPGMENLVLVLGAEGTGLRRLVAERCDLAVRLPIAPAIESLNVSVAAGIALYAAARRRAALVAADAGST